MVSTTLLVKNMVCNRCIIVVEDILLHEFIPFQKVSIGEVQLVKLSPEQKERLTKRLESVGFELIDNRNSALIEKIKQLIMKRARNEEDKNTSKMKLSNYLSAQVNKSLNNI